MEPQGDYQLLFTPPRSLSLHVRLLMSNKWLPWIQTDNRSLTCYSLHPIIYCRIKIKVHQDVGLLLLNTCGPQQISAAVEARGMTALLSLVIVTHYMCEPTTTTWRLGKTSLFILKNCTVWHWHVMNTKVFHFWSNKSEVKSIDCILSVTNTNRMIPFLIGVLLNCQVATARLLFYLVAIHFFSIFNKDNTLMYIWWHSPDMHNNYLAQGFA